MDEKPELIAFSENLLGGVQSFYYNLLSNDADDSFRKKWLLIDLKGHISAKPASSFNLNETIVELDRKKGRWRNALKLSKLISNHPGLVLTNHHIELDSLFLYPKPNKTVFHFTHDEVYLEIADQYKNIIDCFISHNYEMYERLLDLFPDRKQHIYYLPYGINISDHLRNENLNKPLNVAFVARLHKDKGLYDIIKIDEILKANNIQVQWTITGDGPEKKEFLELIKTRENFKHIFPSTTKELLEELSACDIFILPSKLDGTPVALLESLSVGLVPIIYRFNKGIEKVINPETGYIVDVGDFASMADTILLLNENRALLEEKSKACVHLARAKFDVKIRAKEYYDVFKKYKTLKHNGNLAQVPYSSRLENPNYPYFFAKWVRAMVNMFKSKK